MFKQIFLITTFSLLLGCEKNIKGFVYDCETNDPIHNAIVSANQSGWGVSNGQIVWDKGYKTYTRTDEYGHFDLTYKVGSSAKIHVTKEGYKTAEQFEDPSDNVKIGVISANGDVDLEYTHNCTPLSECLSCVENNGITECRDICFD